MHSGLPVDAFAPRLSFFFNAHIDFFEEIAEVPGRAAHLGRWMRSGTAPSGRAFDELRFHTQTAGCR